jgi:hypothetical protein
VSDWRLTVRLIRPSMPMPDGFFLRCNGEWSVPAMPDMICSRRDSSGSGKGITLSTAAAAWLPSDGRNRAATAE